MRYLFWIAKVAILLFLILVWPANSAEQVKGWWQNDYDLAMLHLQAEHFDVADSIFISILEKDKKLAQAWYGRGLVATARDPKSDRGRKYFLRAIRYDKTFSNAYLELAKILHARNQSIQKVREYLRKAIKYDPTMNEAWKMLLDIEADFMQTSSVFRAYAQVIMKYPEIESLYDNFVELGLFQSDYEATENVLNELLRFDPDNTKYRFDLARVYYLERNYDKSLELLNKIEAEQTGFSKTQLYLYKSYNYFELKQEDVGLDYYWSAVNSVKDSADAKLLFDDACYIMKDEEFDWLQSLPIDSIPRFYYRFWRARDPNPSTRDNERLLEHYRRYTYAQRECRRFARPKKSIQYSNYRYFRDLEEVKEFNRTNINSAYDVQNAEGIVEFYNQALRYVLVGEELERHLKLPKAIPRDRKIDDMGLTIIRHGVPDVKIATPGSMNVPACVSFKYYATPQRPEMVFHFLYFPQTGWMFSSMPVDMTGRWELGPQYARQENLFTDFEQLSLQLNGMPGQPQAQASMLVNKISNDLQNISDESLVGIQAGLQTDSYVMSGDPIFYPYQLVCSKSENNRTRVELFYLIHGSEFALAGDDSNRYVDVHKTLNFFSKRWDELYHVDHDEQFHVGFDANEWPNRGFVNLDVFDVKPGQYVIEMQLTDNSTNRTGVVREKFIVPDFSDSLRLSDIILSGPLKPASGTTIFTKGDIDYSPHMFTSYRSDEQIGTYFEVYNLQHGRDGKTRFSVTCTFQAPGTDKAEHVQLVNVLKRFFQSSTAAVGTTFEYESKNSDEKIYLNLDIGEKKPGKYKLVFLVQDLNSGESQKKTTAIYIE